MIDYAIKAMSKTQKLLVSFLSVNNLDNMSKTHTVEFVVKNGECIALIDNAKRITFIDMNHIRQFAGVKLLERR